MENTEKELFSQLAQAVIEGKQEITVALTNELLTLGTEPKRILDEGLMPGMEVVGIRFRDNIIFVPQVLISARAMKSSLAILEPLLSKSDISGAGTIIIGTVKGDIHDIGKNIVAMMLRSSGFKVVDIGIDAKVEKFLLTAEQEGAQILGMSALLTTTMGYMKTVVTRVRDDKLPYKIMVGGAPISRQFAEQIGADGYARNATEAVAMAKKLMEEFKTAS
ncbi:MAG: corrinoid protein [Ignavibacteriaceae bacterium]|nr:corrinoid protein [Ignavibacteriaceae bacterium]